LQLHNPHSVLAVFETRPQDVLEVRLSSRPSAAWNDVAELARRHRVPVGVAQNPRGTARGLGRSGAATASMRERDGVELEELFAATDGSPHKTGLWLALDTIQDPHNVGAIFRSAAFFGVRGIVLTQDRSAPLNATVYDVASGGVEHMPFSLQTNLSRSLDEAKQAGLWVLGASEHAGQDVSAVDRRRPWLLVAGNEEKGLRRLTLSKCDELCRLTARGRIGSLNVSVATAVLMSELTR
ncbi:MAG: 23S rRNA (guanosine(2251)-2'-O)-methyltransferase RlmB, partial [Planctomycetaceae bacterium]